MKTRTYDERLGWHEHIHLESPVPDCDCGHRHFREDEDGGDDGCQVCECRWWHREEMETVTQSQIAEADHKVRCEPIATAEQWCFHKHIEYANDLMRVMRGGDLWPSAGSRELLDSLDLLEEQP